MTIKELLNMPIGQKIGGGFILTVKTTKKAVQLPDKRYIHTGVLVDNTGEILADFKDPVIGQYNPIGKGWQYHIIVAEIQSADPTSNKTALKDAKKLFIDQYEKVKGGSEPDYGFPDFSTEDFTKTIRSKILCWLTAAKIEAGANNLQVLEFLNNERTKQIVDKILEG